MILNDGENPSLHSSMEEDDDEREQISQGTINLSEYLDNPHDIFDQ